MRPSIAGEHIELILIADALLLPAAHHAMKKHAMMMQSANQIDKRCGRRPFIVMKYKNIQLLNEDFY